MRARPFVPLGLPLLLLAPLLAGCLEGATPEGVPDAKELLTAPLHGILAEALPMVMDDGVTLDGWVFRPDAPEGERFPVILETSPYFSNSDPALSTGGQKFSLWLIDHFVPRGYAVVLQSVRGTGNSEGCFGMGGPREMQDHYDVVEALAAEPWSNGKVAMIGKSYRGTTPHMAAVLNPPHLTTIVPIAGITDWYWYTQTHGATYTSWATFNAYYFASVGMNANPFNPDASQAQSDLPRMPGRFCEDAAELIAETATNAVVGDYTEFYRERNYAKDVAGMTASVYLVHGFQDWNVKPDQFGDWFNEVRSPKRAVLGQMDHEYPLRGDWGEDLHRWLDYTLKGIENGIMDEPSVRVEDSLGRWRLENAWPPMDAAPSEFFLGADGTLAKEAPRSGSLRYVSSPDSEPRPGAGQTDTQLAFVSKPLDADLHTVGRPEVSFTASVSAPNTQFNGILYEVQGGEWTRINRAALDARHRESLEQGEPLTPGAPAEFTLRFHPQDHVFQAGSAIALLVTGSNPDWIVPEPGTEIVDFEAGEGASLRFLAIQDVVLEDPQPERVEAVNLPWTSAENRTTTLDLPWA